MFLDFFFKLRTEGFPISLHEYLALMEGLEAGLVRHNLDDFYFLSRSILVKSETRLDQFDRIFGEYFKGAESHKEDISGQVPDDWLMARLKDLMDPETLDRRKKDGSLQELLERLRKLLEEQKERHEGGNKWIGSGGTSPFGNSGFSSEGFRMGGSGGNRRAARIWNKREFSNLKGDVELNTRNIKMALRRLRLLTREGAPDEFDLDGTIKRTSKNGGLLDISMVPTRRNRVKVLLFMDVGGSMDDHVHSCEELFSAAKHEFKHMAWFYFHNCIYETVWKDNRRRGQRISIYDILAKYKKDYKVIVLGDAAMSPYELMVPGGSMEHYNEESGLSWLKRLQSHFKYMSWINPNPDYGWSYFQTTQTIRAMMGNRMFPMTMRGLANCMHSLRDSRITHDEVWVRN